MEAQGHDWGAVWGSIKHLVAKSLVAIQPLLQYHYRSATKPDDDGFTCFEVGVGTLTEFLFLLATASGQCLTLAYHPPPPAAITPIPTHSHSHPFPFLPTSTHPPVSPPPCQVLGYDVLLDESLRPWLLEVNHSPSFTTDTPLDLAIKERLITQTMHLVGGWLLLLFPCWVARSGGIVVHAENLVTDHAPVGRFSSFAGVCGFWAVLLGWLAQAGLRHEAIATWFFSHSPPARLSLTTL